MREMVRKVIYTVMLMVSAALFLFGVSEIYKPLFYIFGGAFLFGMLFGMIRSDERAASRNRGQE